jgi:hypothetical protein
MLWHHAPRAVLFACALIGVCAFVVAPAAMTSSAQAQTGSAESQIVPKLNVPIPGLELGAGEGAENPLLAQYIAGIYRFAISIVVVAATVMFIYGAFLYLLGSAITSIQSGKQIMIDAIVGMILLLSAYTILKVLNPDLLDLKALMIKPVETLEPTGTIQERNPATGAMVTTPILGKSKGNYCLLQTFGATDAEISNHITAVTFLGDKHFIHELAAPDFQAAFNELETAPADSVIGTWVKMMKRMPPYSAYCGSSSGYPDRGSRTGGSYAARLDKRIAMAEGADRGPCISCDLHALGLATDIDPCFNTMCPKGETCTLTDGKYNRFPKEVVDVFERHHIYWGGYGWKTEGLDWDAAVSGRDAMHFEWHGICW